MTGISSRDLQSVLLQLVGDYYARRAGTVATLYGDGAEQVTLTPEAMGHVLAVAFTPDDATWSKVVAPLPLRAAAIMEPEAEAETVVDALAALALPDFGSLLAATLHETLARHVQGALEPQAQPAAAAAELWTFSSARGFPFAHLSMVGSDGTLVKARFGDPPETAFLASHRNLAAGGVSNIGVGLRALAAAPEAQDEDEGDERPAPAPAGTVYH